MDIVSPFCSIKSCKGTYRSGTNHKNLLRLEFFSHIMTVSSRSVVVRRKRACKSYPDSRATNATFASDTHFWFPRLSESPETRAKPLILQPLYLLALTAWVTLSRPASSIHLPLTSSQLNSIIWDYSSNIHLRNSSALQRTHQLHRKSA